MTDVTVVENEVSLPYTDFADWMSSVQVGLDRENFQLRWNTINRLFIDIEDDLDSSWVTYLLTLALANLKSSPELAERFILELKKEDLMFSNSGGKRNEELRVLASYALKLLIDSSIYDNDFVSRNLTLIQGASLSNKRKFKGGVDLLSIVAAERFKLSRELRKRKPVVRAYSNFKKSEEFESEFKALEDAAGNVTFNRNALLALKKEFVSQLVNTNNSLGELKTSIDLELNKLAEEQEVLWLTTVGWSELHDKSFSELALGQRILSSAISLAERTLILSELPSIKGVAAKLGIEATEIQFSDWVEEISKNEIAYLTKYISDSGELTPVLFALDLASKGNWKSNWKDSIGVDYNFKICGRELVVQLYRELLIIKWS
ncbi:GTPase-associated system all-helical protein GASH [Vibrio parahaemolyticus]|uniref:GTPase-associated system all-helical protein GASH n=1 Tax=Vibrio parahaemolyticus TaxID=670 RepID=UPI00248FDE12|nr:GTPase-associated system all-helical protein GASH [Vibrio parahaemolyticus]